MAENLQDYLKKYGITSPKPTVAYNAPKQDLSGYLKNYGIDTSINTNKYALDLGDELAKMQANQKQIEIESKRIHDLFAAQTYPTQSSVPAYTPVNTEKATPWEAVKYTFLSGMANLVRTTFTPDKDKPVDTENNAGYNFLKNSPYVKNLNKNPIKSDSATGVIAKATTEKVIPATEAYRNKSGDYLKKVETEYAKKADLENQDWKVRVIANAISSTPVSVATRIPVIGWVIMGNQSYRNALEKTQARIANGENISGNAAMLNAIGSAGIEIGSEMMFGLFRKAGNTKMVGSLIDATRGYLDGILGKGITQIGKTAMGQFVKSVAKTPVSQVGLQILQQGAEEGSEEVVGGIGSGILAKLTTDKAADMFSFNDKNSLITFMGLTEAFLTGAVSGGGITAVRSAPVFVHRNNWISATKKTVGDLNAQDGIDYVEALKTDMQSETNQEFVADATSSFVENNTSPEKIKSVQKIVDDLINIKSETDQEPSGVPFSKYTGVPLSGTRYNTVPVVEPIAQPVKVEPVVPVAPEPIQKPVQARTTSSMKKVNKVAVEKTESVKTGVESDIVTTGKFKKGTYNKIIREDGKQVSVPVEGQVYKGVGINSDNLITHTQSGVMLYNGRELNKTNAKKVAVWIADNLNALADTKEVVMQMRETDVNGMTFKDKLNAYIESITDKTPISATKTPVIAEKPQNTQEKIAYSKDKANKAQPKVIEIPEEKPMTNREFTEKYGEKKKTAKEINEEVVSEIVKESQAQDDSFIDRIIPKSAQKHLNSVKAQPVTSYQDTISDEVQERRRLSSDFNKNEPVADKVSKLKKWAQKNVTYGSIPIDPKYGDIRVGFRELRMSDRIASQEAEKLIALSYNKAGKDKHQLMIDAIFYFDIVEDINNGRYDKDDAMMFGIKNPEEAIRTAQAIARELKKPENSFVVDAMETRRRLMDEVRTRLVNEGKKAGIDLSIVFAKKDYMHHAISEYQKELNDAKKAQKKNGKIKYKERTGSDKDYIANPVVADFIILRSMERNIARIKLYNPIKVQDISESVSRDSNGEYDIPDGYAELDPSTLGVVTYDADSKSKMVAMALKTLQANGISSTSPEGRKILKAAEREAQKTMLIVPVEIAEAVQKEFERPEHGVSKGMKKIMNTWKYSKIRLPNVVIKYNMRNLYGDLDAVFIGRPQALAKVPQAVKELFAFYYRNGVMTADLKDFIDRTGLSTGQTIQELKALKGSKLFEFYEDAITTQDATKKGIAKLWKKLTLETETEFREQILRYAAYLSFNAELSKSSSGMPKYYAASIPREIQSITDTKTRAAKLANDLLGAYDDTSIAGQYAADHLIPFYRFMEVNVKRYFRLTKNIFYNDPATMRTIGENSASRIGMAGRVGASVAIRMAKVTLGVTLFYGLMDMFNKTFAPDEEDKLTEEAKRSPHITIPSWFLGGDNGRTYYFDRLGSFSDLLNMFGIDRGIKDDVSDILKGKMSLNDKLKQMAMSPIYNTYNSASPLFKMTTELLTGKSFYPNPSNPTQIRDKWEYVFKQLGLADEYKLIAGKPMPNGSYAQQKRNILFNSVQSGDTAYWDLVGIKDQFFKVKGIGKRYTAYDDTKSIDFKRANAMYYYKQAIKMKDYNAAQKYLAEYAIYGGNDKRKKASMDAMNPLFGMSNDQKKMFTEWLDAEDRKTYDKAMNYFEDISTLG